ncbi:hypothetical protein [Loigolactobacillus iwatensis]|uniref:hypothetical protein n=1 Tax=Loigolactobacillus iwatensis TaxID=1267156 RepID=UPI000F7F02E2|nr:hypothetical protein [Loigolactobacillus iwatensis]
MATGKVYRHADGTEEFVEDTDTGGTGLAVGLVILIFALPVAILWWILFHVSKKRYGWIHHSLSKFKRVVLLLWATALWWTVLSVSMDSWMNSSNVSNPAMHTHTAQGSAFVGYSVIALLLIGFNYFRLKSKGLNPWSGTRKVRSKSVTHAIGMAVLILLIAFSILSFFMGLTASIGIALIIALIGYFLIENFL